MCGEMPAPIKLIGAEPASPAARSRREAPAQELDQAHSRDRVRGVERVAHIAQRTQQTRQERFPSRYKSAFSWRAARLGS
jgi:hypothetical protein